MKKKIWVMAVAVVVTFSSACAAPQETIQNLESQSEMEEQQDNGDLAEKPLPDKIENEPKDAAFEGSVVTIAKAGKALATEITQEEIEAMVNAVLDRTGEFDSLIENGQTVVIKPNLVQMKVDSTGELLDVEVNGITTDWRVTNAVVKRIRELNPDGKVYIVEGSATGPTSQVLQYYNYSPQYMEGVDGFISLEEDCGAWQDFNAPEVTRVDYEEGLLHQSYYFSSIVYEADVLISIPCLKTSSGVVVTAGIKNVSLGTPPGNLYGVSPDNPGKTNMVSHKIVDGELDQWIHDYYMCKPIDYVIVDGLQGFQSGPVPMSGERKESDKMNMGVILGGSDAISVDTVCALITGWKPESVGYLNHLKESGAGIGDVEKISVRGAYVDELRKNFTLRLPELGGDQIPEQPGPALDGMISQDEEMLYISYTTDEHAIKWEIYMDGFFLAGAPVDGPSGTIEAPWGENIPKGGTVQVVFYDAYLNKTVLNSQID